MTRLRFVLVAAVAALTVAGIAVAVPTSMKFSVHTTGAFEVPMRDTDARGQAIFTLSRDGQSLGYVIGVDSIENVTMAHIHRGPPGMNGDIVVWLYPTTANAPAAPGGGPVSGVLARGTITEDDLVGPLQNAELEDLVELLQSGGAYVNVHTNDGVGPPDTGPGDFPGGEMRGNF
jgi:hypothetical protein